MLDAYPQPADAHAVPTREAQLAEVARIDDERHRLDGALRTALDALPSLRPWDAPPDLRARIVELATTLDLLDDRRARLRAGLDAMG